MTLKNEWCILACFLLLIKITLQNPLSYYTAGVVEYYSVKNIVDPLGTANTNAKNYVTIIKKAADHKVDIIVFPEAGLTSKPGNHTQLLKAASYVPDPKDSVVPCTSKNGYPEYLRTISCAAEKYKMYVVINIHEQANCSKCDLKLYNTNVVFNKSGTVVARYRKYNLFEPKEYGISTTAKLELSSFTTDFEVTFGQLIGFDILNKSPALTLIKEKKITDIIFSTHWVNSLPFLTALQYQFGFSYAKDINFLGSGSNDPNATSRGSGIFAGTNILNKFWSDDPSNVLLVANVSKVKNGKRDPDVKNKPITHKFDKKEVPTINENSKPHFLYEDFNAYTTEIYAADKKTENNTKLCNGGLCCIFNITSTFKNNPGNLNFIRHRLVVFKGVRDVTVKTIDVEVCGVISCLNESLTSCGQVPPKSHLITTFNSIKISRSIDKGFEDSKFYVPSVLKSNTNLLDSTQFAFTIDKTQNNATLSLKTPLNDLMTFAIYGRDFTKDKSPVSGSATNFPTNVIFITILSIIISREILY